MIRKILALAVCVFAIAVIQSTLLEYIKIFDIQPNLLLVFIVAYALVRGNWEGAILGFFAGLTHDIVTGKVIGFYALLGLYLGLIVGSLNKRLYRESFFVMIFFTFVSTMIYEWIVYILSTILKGQLMFMFPLRYIILPEALYNSVASVFMFILVIKLDDWFERSKNISRKY